MQSTIWITELDAMKIIGRGKSWFAKERMGSKRTPPSLFEGTDWRRVNGRTPEYKATSIERRKLVTNNGT